MRSVNLGRWSRFVERYFNIKGGGGLMDVDPSVRTILPIQSGVEDRYLQGWNRYIGSYAVVGVAAQFSRCMLRNPPGSNVIAVVESLFINLATSSAYTITNNQPNLATVQAPGTLLRRLDARAGFTDSTCVLSSDTNATEFPGSAAVVMRRTVLGEVFVTESQQWPLLPNDALWMVADAVNVSIQINVQWRERAMEASELT